MTHNGDLRRDFARALEHVEELLEALPTEQAKKARNKLKQLREMLFDQRPPRFVLVGRRGSGKSSLINAFFGEKVAEVGHEKAQTGAPKWFSYGTARGELIFLDTRGFQEAHAPAEVDGAATALESILDELEAQCPDTVLFLVKATEAGAAMDEDLDQLERLHKRLHTMHGAELPVVAVATQCDMVEPKNHELHAPDGGDPSDRREKLARIKRIERQIADQLRGVSRIKGAFVTAIGVSAYQSWGEDGTLRADERWRIEDLVEFLYEQLPREARLELVRLAQVKKLQRNVARSLTSTVATACALVGATPIPIGDIAPITSLQLMLVTTIGYVSGRSLTKDTALEFLAATGVNVGAGLVLREAARAFLKLLPGVGSIASAAVAFAGTMAIGEAAAAYFIDGATPAVVKERMKKARQEAQRQDVNDAKR